MSQKSWEDRVSALALETRQALRGLAPAQEGDRIKTRISRAARTVGLPYWRTFDLWYGKARRIEAHELEAIRAARDAKLLEDARAEYRSLRQRIAACEAALGLPNADLDRARPPARRGMAGGEDRALDCNGERR